MNEQTVFTAAIERDPAERPAFLDEACGTDQQLRVRVEKLIELHENAGNFLERPAAGAGPTVELLVEQPGMQVGPYKLLQPIGEGGMGVVYMAEQLEPVRRMVALKVIKPGMDSRQVIARFEAERQALAMMDHVNIARVIDAGTTEAGRPYFVMELVRGVPITQYCDDNHLTPRQRLELFVPVCQAIQHAHQKGIIHRDIKPSNVMITLYDGKPVPKVIDFGVAKATEQKLTERTLFTQYGTLVGTLEYMSPEQAEMSALGVDTRSDIYSLGVLLYELLTGSTPLSRKQMQKAAFAEILRLIKEEEPPRPSTRLSESGEALASISAQRHTEPAKLSKLIRGELDWIVMKTLEKDRNRRYETASGFAADVQRYLSDEAVLACPPSAGYRFRKFARRNRATLTLIAVVAVALFLGIVGTSWQAIRATLQRDRAVAAEDLAASRLVLAEKAEAEAQANFQQARQTVDDMYTQVAEKWLAQQPQMQPLQHEFLQKALRFYENSSQRTGLDPEVRFETAQAYRRVAEIQHRLRQLDQAEQAFNRAIERLQELADELPGTPLYRQELADALHKYGVTIGDTGRFPEEERAHRRALALQEILADDFPGVTEYRRDLGRGYSYLGAVLGHLRQPQAREAAYRSALGIQTSLVAEFPSIAEYRQDLAASQLGFGETLRWMGRHQENLQALRDAAGILEKLVADFPAVAVYRNQLANVLYWLGIRLPPQDHEAEQRLWQALNLQEKLATDFPAVADCRYDVLRSLGSLGTILLDNNRAQDAEQPLRRAVEIGERLSVESPTTHYYRSSLARVYRGLADVLSRSDRLPEAETQYEASIRLYEQLIVEFPDVSDMGEQILDSYVAFGKMLAASGRQDEADSVCRQAAALLEGALAEHPNVLQGRRKLAEWLNDSAWGFATSADLNARDATLALELANKGIELEPSNVFLPNTLGVAHYRAGNWREAIKWLEKSIERRDGGDAFDWFFLAMAHWQLGDFEQARKWHEQSVRWMEKQSPTNAELIRFRAEAEQLLGSQEATDLSPSERAEVAEPSE